MPKPANYFRIGVFILVGVAILVGGLLIFGAGQMFKREITFETYERGTVQGIDIGSPVKFRGVQIGKVTWIGFTFNTYPQTNQNNKDNYVIIRMQVNKEIFPNMFHEDLGPILERGIGNGLRVRIEPQGITGMNYLEINFVDDPKLYPVLTVSWTPEFYYIPSAPGELTDILDSVNKMMRDVEQMNLGEIQGGLTQLLQNLNQAVKDADLDKLSTNLQDLMAEIQKAITAANVGPLSDDARKLMSGLQSSNEDLKKVLKNIEPATRFNPQEVRDIVNNMASITANLEAFSAYVKQRPSLLLWGSPPKSTPTPSPTPRPKRR